MTLTFDTAPLIGPGTLDRLRVRADRAMAGPPDEIIEERYLRRWHVVRGPALSLYLHLYVGGDPCAWPHDPHNAEAYFELVEARLRPGEFVVLRLSGKNLRLSHADAAAA